MNSTRAIRATLLATILLAFAAQCSTPSIQAPAGFAQYEGRGSEFNLVSPDAVRVRVYKTSNQPKGDLATLTNAMELHFDSLGYEVIKSQSIATNDGLQGRLFVTRVMTMNGEYRYLASFFPAEDDILIVEAGGRKEYFEPYEKDLIAKIRTLKAQ